MPLNEPVRVLRDAVSLIGIADIGPILLSLHNLEAKPRSGVKAAAKKLLA